jgi:hypothetical protein
MKSVRLSRNEMDKDALGPKGVLNTAGTNTIAIGANGGALSFGKAIWKQRFC